MSSVDNQVQEYLVHVIGQAHYWRQIGFKIGHQFGNLPFVAGDCNGGFQGGVDVNGDLLFSTRGSKPAHCAHDFADALYAVFALSKGLGYLRGQERQIRLINTSS